MTTLIIGLSQGKNKNFLLSIFLITPRRRTSNIHPIRLQCCYRLMVENKYPTSFVFVKHHSEAIFTVDTAQTAVVVWLVIVICFLMNIQALELSRGEWGDATTHGNQLQSSTHSYAYRFLNRLCSDKVKRLHTSKWNKINAHSVCCTYSSINKAQNNFHEFYIRWVHVFRVAE